MPRVANFLRKRSIVLLMAESENFSSFEKIRSPISSMETGEGDIEISFSKTLDSRFERVFRGFSP